MLGIDPCGYSLRQLFWMIDARNKHAWDQTDLLACLIFNNPYQTKPVSAGAFHPYRKQAERKTRKFTPVPAGVLGSYFKRNA